MQPTRLPIWTLARLRLTDRQQLVNRIFQLLLILSRVFEDEQNKAYRDGKSQLKFP